VFKETDFIPPPLPGQLPEQWELKAEAPSNIALIKYWGKKGLQLPMNASLSFLLPQSFTRTRARGTLLEPKENFDFTFLFDGKENPGFKDKIQTFFDRIRPYAPAFFQYRWTFDSSNNFPHAAGIASSASGFAALAKIIMVVEKHIYQLSDENFIRAKTSFLARLGSGSASRSVVKRVGVWGKHPSVPGSNDLYAIDLPYEIHPAFDRMKDMILLLQKGEKAVSSTQGHALLDHHPFKIPRIEQAQENLTRLISALKLGDWELFGKITENEALTLHAMMMTSDPYYILMEPETLRWIKTLWQLRRDTKWPVYFTLDAGANLHVLFPADMEPKLRSYLPAMFEIPHLLNTL